MKQHDKKDLETSEKAENIAALTVFGVLLILVVGFFTNGFGLLGKGSELGDNIYVPYENDPIRGNATQAKVKIYVFTDFECPFCKKGEATLQKVFDKYNGQVALVFKQFPLTAIHPNAFSAALASECADEQGKFWEYHDYLFSHQNALSIPDLKAYAAELGLDKEKFSMCLDSQRYASSVNSDAAIGKQVGVTSTPTFIINGQALVGAQPEPEFDRIIQAELSK